MRKLRWRKRRADEGVSPVIAVILMVAITVVLAGVVYVWVMSMTATRVAAPTIRMTLKDASPILNDTDQSQNVTTLTSDGPDKVKWGDIKVMLSNDEGTTWSKIEIDGAAALNVKCFKEEPIEKDEYWSTGEALRFQESGGNWDPADDFYVKIIHVPTGDTIQSLSKDIE
jgi:flagellin-like protein